MVPSNSLILLKRFISSLFILMLSHVGLAQITPVQVTPQLLPPYSLQVSDYYSGVQPKLQVMLLNRDINQPVIRVRLRMTVESQNCRMRTRPNAVTPVFTLTNGVPFYLTPQDLQAFFLASNLEIGGGYSEQQYVQTGRLPEGLYSIYFEAFEEVTGNLVSNKGFSLGWLTLAEPPILNTPARNEDVKPGTPQNIVFNWTPRHNTSVTAGYYTDYVFTIVEYMDTYMSPDAAFTANPPLFMDSVQNTTYLMGAAHPQLIPGRRYAWRVQAKSKDGSNQPVMFRNNGFSEVFVFNYRNNCNAPLGIISSINGQRASVEWQNDPMHLEWRVEYREKNNPKAEWFSLSNTLPRVLITDLKPGTQYEYRVGGACIASNFVYSPLGSFTTAGFNQNYMPGCGDTILPAPGSGNPRQTLVAGDSIQAGSFTVYVGYVTGTGSFSGQGYVIVPWLANAKVEVQFSNITVSEDKKLLTGEITTTYDPTESGIDDIDEYIDIFKAGMGVGDVITGLNQADTTFNFEIAGPGSINVVLPPSYNPQTGKGTEPISITVQPVPSSGPGGSTPAPANYTVDSLPTTLKDAKDNVFKVNQNGQVVQIASGDGKSLLESANRKKIDSDKGVVHFIDYPEKQKYAFDGWKEVYKKSSTFSKEYERLENYYVSQKAIAPSETDFIKAQVELKDSSINPRNIEFVSGTGVKYVKKALDSTYTLYEIEVIGGPGKDAQEIYALYKPTGSKTLNLGKIKVSSYPRRDYTVKIVSVNNATYNLQNLRDSINRIYNKINIYLNVESDLGFNSDIWDDGDNKLNVVTSNRLQRYSPEMKSLINNFKSDRYVDPKSIYLFVLSEALHEQGGVLEGDMPKGKQFGFLFNNAQNVSAPIVAAHEIGHGLFRLNHLEEYGFAESDLQDNLMQNFSNTSFSKAQWDLIFDPPLISGFFDRTEDEAFVSFGGVKLDSTFLNSDKLSFTFLTPGGTYITLPSEVKNTFYLGKTQFQRYFDIFYPYIPGALQSFTIGKNTYTACYFTDVNTGKRSFLGYKLIPLGNSIYKLADDYDSEYLPESYIKDNALENLIMGVYTDKGFSIVKFGASLLSIQPYSNTTIDIPNDTELYNKLKPYSSSMPVSVQYGNPVSRTIRYYADDETFEGNGDFFRSSVSQHFDKPTILLSTKIAMWRFQFNEVFNSFTEFYESWGWNYQFPSYGLTFGASIIISNLINPKEFDNAIIANTDGIRTKWESNDKGDFYISFLSLLKNYNITKNLEINSFLSNLSDSSSRSDVIQKLRLMSPAQFYDLPMEKRILLLDIVSSGPMLGDVEEIGIKLIKLISNETLALGGADVFLLALEKKSVINSNEVLLNNLIYHLDDANLGIGDNNFKEFMLQIFRYCSYSKKFSEEVGQINRSNIEQFIVNYNYTGFYKRIANSFSCPACPIAPLGIQTQVDMDSDNNVRIKNEYLRGFFKSFESGEFVFRPFSPVILVNKSELALSKGIGYSEEEFKREMELYKRGSVTSEQERIPFLVVPALLVNYVDEKADNELIVDCITTAVDVVTIATGFGTAYQAISTFRKAMAIIDITGSSISLAGNVGASITDNVQLKEFSNTTSAVFGFLGILNADFPVGSKVNNVVNTLKDEHQLLEWSKVEAYANSITSIANGDKAEIIKIFDLSISAKSARITEKVIDKLIIESQVSENFDVYNKLVKAKSIIKEVKGLGAFELATGRIFRGFNWLSSSVSQLWKNLFVDLKKLEELGFVLVRETNDNIRNVYFKKAETDFEFLLGRISDDGSGFIPYTDNLNELTNTTKEDIFTVLDNGRFSITCKNNLCGLVEGGCVTSETLISTINGLIPVTQVKENTLVSAYDEDNKKSVFARVTKIFTRGVGRIIEVFNDFGEKFSLTPNHPVYVPAVKNYIRADSLKIGLILLGLNSNPFKIDSISVKDTVATVYNFEVEKFHNYRIGSFGVLVHNGGGCFNLKWPELAEMPEQFFDYFVSLNRTDLIDVFSDLYKNKSEILNKFKNQEYNWEAWEILFNSSPAINGAHLTDPPTLLSVSNFYKNDLNVMGMIPNDNIYLGKIVGNKERFREMMNGLKRRYACSTCKNEGASNLLSNRMSDLETILSDIKYAINNYPKFKNFLNEGQIFNSIFDIQTGRLFEMATLVRYDKILSNLGAELQQGKRLSNSNRFFDFYWVGKLFLEVKCYSLNTIRTIGSGDWKDYQQFLAYIRDKERLTSWGMFKLEFSAYPFNGDVQMLRRELVVQFQMLFKKNREEIFNAIYSNPGLKKDIFNDETQNQAKKFFERLIDKEIPDNLSDDLKELAVEGINIYKFLTTYGN